MQRSDRVGALHYRNMAVLSGLLYESDPTALADLVRRIAKRRDRGLPRGIPADGRWDRCAMEDQICHFPGGPRLLRYGADVRWVTRMFNASPVPCTTLAFDDDPAMLTVKRCERWADPFIRPTT